MVGAVSSQVGIKEEQPDLPLLQSPPKSREFHQALKRATHRRPGASPPTAEERPQSRTERRQAFRESDRRLLLSAAYSDPCSRQSHTWQQHDTQHQRSDRHDDRDE